MIYCDAKPNSSAAFPLFNIEIHIFIWLQLLLWCLNSLRICIDIVSSFLAIVYNCIVKFYILNWCGNRFILKYLVNIFCWSSGVVARLFFEWRLSGMILFLFDWYRLVNQKKFLTPWFCSIFSKNCCRSIATSFF